MEGYEASTYGERWASTYDELHHTSMDPTEAVEFLVKQAGVGPALELAIGTGRVALPLAARGIDVHGIDISEPMVARLREKPGGQDIPVTIGDFADVGVEGSYPLSIRFAYPSELDLMARIAGLRLRERGGSWARESYTGEGEHVSVYEKPSH